MKNFKYILSFLAVAAVLFTSCEEPELYPRFGEEDGQSSVAFVSSSVSIDESTVTSYADGTSTTNPSVGTIELVRNSNDITAELTVGISVSATFVSDNDFVDAGEDASAAIKITQDLTAVTFAANSATTSFNVVTIDDVLAKGNIEVQFEITSVSDSKYQIGYQSGKVRSTTTLTVVDDDCPVDRDMLTGSFELTVTNLGSGAATSRVVEIEADPSSPFGLIVTDLVVFGTVPTSTVNLTIVTCPKALVYDPTASIGLYQGTNNVLMQRRDGFFTGQPGPHFAEAGYDLDPDNPLDWGFYDDEAGELTIYAWLFVDPLGSFGGHEFNLTKIEE